MRRREGKVSCVRRGRGSAGAAHGGGGEEGVCGLEWDDEGIGNGVRVRAEMGDGGGGEVVDRLTKRNCAPGCSRPTLRGEAAKEGAPRSLRLVEGGPPVTVRFVGCGDGGHQPLKVGVHRSREDFRCREMAHLRRGGAAPKMGHPVLWLVRPGPPATQCCVCLDLGHPP